jgi:hypothetical protein
MGEESVNMVAVFYICTGNRTMKSFAIVLSRIREKDCGSQSNQYTI